MIRIEAVEEVGAAIEPMWVDAINFFLAWILPGALALYGLSVLWRLGIRFLAYVGFGRV